MSHPQITPPTPVKSPFRFGLHNLLFLLLGIALGKYQPLLYTRLRNELHNMQPPCQLGRICWWYHRRPLLQDGRVSSPLWDVARKHMSEQYSIVSKLLTRSSKTSADHVFHNVRSESSEQHIELPLHHLDSTSANTVRNLVRFLGFATNRYVHRVVLRRYNSGSSVQPTLQRWQTFGNRNGTACTLAAVAQLTLRAPATGGAITQLWRNVSGAGQNKETFRGATEEGDLFAWYLMHPMTETMAWSLWQGMDRVEGGVKVVMETEIRGCRQVVPN